MIDKLSDDARFWRDLLAAVVRETDDREYEYPWDGAENAPGHAHDVPGIWDADNGKKAGKPCAWCMTWNRARAALAASPAPAIPAYPAKHISLKTRRDRKIVLTLELDAVEGAAAYLLTPVNPGVVRAAPAISESEDAVAWQIRRISSNGAPLNQWETCTKELYDATLATGRYAGYEKGPRCEVRELVAARKGEKS